MNEITNTQQISAQTTLTATDKKFKQQITEIQERKENELQEKTQLQVIEVHDWGIVEEENYKGELEKYHSFLVGSDNAIVAIGMGDIDDAIQEVKEELLGLGYRYIVLKRIPMKQGQRIGNEDEVMA